MVSKTFSQSVQFQTDWKTWVNEEIFVQKGRFYWSDTNGREKPQVFFSRHAGYEFSNLTTLPQKFGANLSWTCIRYEFHPWDPSAIHSSIHLQEAKYKMFLGTIWEVLLCSCIEAQKGWLFQYGRIGMMYQPDPTRKSWNLLYDTLQTFRGFTSPYTAKAAWFTGVSGFIPSHTKWQLRWTTGDGWNPAPVHR